ncbi:hypothetical protein MKEN_00541900 [Mycena kentingensis (nom. inval.)]|nr:hypothetical protein MKEN_00541900 [Mycena kentingensis (nom. inval.)]
MHPALELLEIRDAICASFNPEGNMEDRKSLARLARTSSCFEAPALDELWREQTSFEPLVRCFPANLFSLEGTQPKIVRAHRPVVQSDWIRPLRYTHRVHKFRMESDLIVTGFLETVALSMPGANLFPRIKTFKLHRPRLLSLPDLALIQMLFLASASELRVLFLDLQALPPAGLSILAGLGTRKFPMLKVLSLRTSTLDDAGIRAVSDFVRTLPATTLVVQVFSFDWDASTYLSELPRIRRLLLDVLPIHNARSLPREHTLNSSVDEPRFPALTHLTIRKATSEALARFLSCFIQHSPLKNAEITLDDLTTEHLHRVSRSLAEHCDPNTLGALTLRMPYDANVEAGGNMGAPLIDALRPLFCFSALRAVSVRTGNAFLLRDDDVAELTRAWTNLSVLRLKSIVNPSVCGPSLESLLHIARNCRVLSCLEMDVLVDASQTPAALSGYTGLNTQDTTPQRNLTRVHIWLASPAGVVEEGDWTCRERLSRVAKILFPRAELLLIS